MVAAILAALSAVTLSAATATLALASFADGADATATLSTDTLAPPGDLTADVCLLGSVTLSWTASPSAWADGYEVRWGTSSGGPYPSSTTSATTSAVVSGLALLTTHYFVVRAYDASWRSTPTPELAVAC